MGADTNARIMVVDDDPDMRTMIGEYLANHGYDVVSAADGDAMWKSLAEGPVDLVILDILMPGDDGLTLARALQARDDLGIIMVSGQRDPADRVVGLEIGADDYIAKPFQLRELLARVRSVLQRTRGRSGGARGAGRRVARFDRWVLDMESRRLTDRDGHEIELTVGEFALLAALVESAGESLDRDRLQTLLQGREWGPFDRGVDVQVGRLRRKIEADPRQPKLIQTVRSVGYRFAVPVTWG